MKKLLNELTIGEVDAIHKLLEDMGIREYDEENVESWLSNGDITFHDVGGKEVCWIMWNENTNGIIEVGTNKILEDIDNILKLLGI